MTFLIFFIVLVEIYLFAVIGGQLGGILTIFIVILSAFLGLGILSKFNVFMQRHGDTPEGVLHGCCVFIAGMLLIIPGFLTNLVSTLLLVPWCRKLLILWILNNNYQDEIQKNGMVNFWGRQKSRGGVIFWKYEKGFWKQANESQNSRARVKSNHRHAPIQNDEEWEEMKKNSEEI